MTHTTMEENSFLNELNSSQLEAVKYTGGPQLIVAGAGSGKTRVLTYKIAYLLQQGTPAYNILSLTFTNKAAREMKTRIAQVVGEKTARYLWMGTFHSIFSRILRNEAQHIGYTKEFTVYDSADTKSLLKKIVKEMALEESLYKPNTLYGRISAAKNNLISPAVYAQDATCREQDKIARLYKMPEVYAEYVNRCRQANAMDFDDLLFNTNTLFRDFPETLAKYQEHFGYIMVDEYQDTNFAQYLIIKKLAERHERICVVGDDAQSIYSFRGANIENILKFQKSYPTAKLFRLEQNYRSTQTIVNAANSLIKKNSMQITKNLFSEKEMGEPLHILHNYTDLEEGITVAEKVRTLHRFEGLEYSEIAILYRTNSQSRIIEDAFRKQAIPYKIYGGLSFYQRKEIKDIISYLRVVINPTDEEALRRIINFPPRGIGETTQNRVWECAALHQCPVWNVLGNPVQYNLQVNGGTAKKLMGFRALLEPFVEQLGTVDAYELTQQIVKASGLIADALSEQTVEAMSRHENMMEMLGGVHEFVETQHQNGETFVSLPMFLSEVSLLTDQDEKGKEQESRVTLMTVHAAKGLEFPAVVIVGMEEGLFPSQFSESPTELEEERRLFYVAITRAERYCYISYAKQRFKNGKTNIGVPSRFIADIDPHYYHKPLNASASNATYNDERTLFQATKPPTPLHQQKTLSKTGDTYVKQAKQEIQTPWKPDTRIRHGIFGEGRVLSCYQENGNEKIDIEFDNGGKKTLLLKFAKLTSLE